MPFPKAKPTAKAAANSIPEGTDQNPVLEEHHDRADAQDIGERSRSPHLDIDADNEGGEGADEQV